jgi:complement component 1 Q subcomponent-binding protein
MDEDMYNEENMDEDMSEDESLAEPADTSAQRGGGNKRAKGTTSRPAIEEEDEDLDEDEDDGLSDEEAMAPSVSLHIVIEKPNRTEAALAIDATAQHGTLVVDNVSYYDSSATAKGATQEAMWAQQGVYAGPPFHTLDEDLQMIVERYLEDRGVGQAMAIFAADYIDVKEQREYLRWLSNVKKFVTA